MLRFALSVLLLAGVSACSSTPPTPTSAPMPTPPRTPTGTPDIAFGDGTHLVGDRIDPGTYRTVGYTENCYWVRLAGFEGGLADWISSGIGPGYHVVTIGPDDAGFDSQDCGAWTAELGVSAPPDPKQDGTYVVNLDMAPGQWTAETGTNCYWARLAGFGGTAGEVIEESLTNDGVAPVVTIAATDVGFTSNGCGSWRGAAP